MAKTEIKQNASGLYELFVDDQRVATGTKSSIESQAQRFGSGSTSSGSAVATSGASATSTKTQSLPPIPDSVYKTVRDLVINQGLSDEDAKSTLQTYLNAGVYSGGINMNRLFPKDFVFKATDGSTQKFTQDGSSRTITTDRPTKQTTVTKDGITTSNVETKTKNDASLSEVLNNPNLSADQKTMIQQIYDAVSDNDIDKATKLSAAMGAAIEFSNPYFKAQVRLATNALERGVAAQEGDLAFKEKQLSNIVNDTLADVASAKGYLSLQEQQELTGLARRKKEDLNATSEQMAALGKTSSSVRTKKENLITDINQGLVESTQRSFSEKQTGLTNQASRLQRDTSLAVDRYRELAAAGKLDILRGTEEKVGSAALGNLGFSNLLGDVGGSIPREQAKDSLSFANNFVF